MLDILLSQHSGIVQKFMNLLMKIGKLILQYPYMPKLRTYVQSLMPINRAYPLVELMKAVKYYTEKTGRRVSFEYGLFGEEMTL